MEVCGPLRIKPPLNVAACSLLLTDAALGVSMAVFTSCQCYLFHFADVRRMPSNYIIIFMHYFYLFPPLKYLLAGFYCFSLYKTYSFRRHLLSILCSRPWARGWRIADE